MWYYICLTFIMLVDLMCARMNSAYHPDLLFKRYIRVKSTKLQKAMILQTNPCDQKSVNRKQYRNKFLISGIVSYLL